MPETKLKGRAYILEASIDGLDFKPVACGTSNGIESEVGTIDFTSKCGDLYEPNGSFSQSFSFEGFAIDEIGTPSKNSYLQLYDAHIASAKFNVRMSDASATVGSIRFIGEVFISSWSMDAADKEGVTFSATFTVVTPPLIRSVI